MEIIIFKLFAISYIPLRCWMENLIIHIRHLICINWSQNNETTPDWRDLTLNLKTALNPIDQRPLTTVYITLATS